MKTFKGYNTLDIILIGLGIISVVISGIVFESKWYIIINTILGLFYVFTQAKGKIATQFIGIVYFCFYIFICYSQKYYGEALLYLIIMIPIYIYGIIHWLNHREKKDNFVIVRSNLSKKEWYISGLSFVVISFLVYFILKQFATELLIINILSFVTMLPAVYLLMRRYKWNHIAFLINDFIVSLLWIFLVLDGNLSFLPMCIYHIFQICYDVYGVIQWIKLEKKQKLSNL